MDSQDHQQEAKAKAVFLKALEKEPGPLRDGYVQGACADNALLYEKVMALIGGYTEDSFLESPAFNTSETLDDTRTESPGTVIGRYKILQPIGEGGMGVVYMADQTEPVVRKVALKIIKLGMDTKQVVARFEAERQALAMMDHPNIAKVLDAGATESGRPYFVMELVRGVPITDYCDKNQLDNGKRLELFIAVCQAIQHAHQKGIIHRDIKPSNVMVTLHDGQAVPKVIDFGIAKATNQRLTEKTLFTHYAQMIGTPVYMSPEQAEMSGLDVDTRTDVYSLGVLLYELLTGTTPFASKELLSLGYGEMQRVIAEQDPPKPSTRMSTMQNEERTVVAKNHSLEESALGKACEGDLDWIVMKSLEKDRSQRYETVNGLVADIQRHLKDEPVTAAAPTFSYQLQKLYRRQKNLLRTAAALIVVLVLGIVGTTWQMVRANRMTESLEQESVRTEEVAGFLDELVREIRPKLLDQGNADGVEAVLDVVGSMTRNALEKNQEAELAMRFELISGYEGLYRPHKVEPHLERAVSLAKDLAARGVEVHADVDLLRSVELSMRCRNLKDEGAWHALIAGANAALKKQPPDADAALSYYYHTARNFEIGFKNPVIFRQAMENAVALEPGPRHVDSLLFCMAFLIRIHVNAGEWGEAEALAMEAMERFIAAIPDKAETEPVSRSLRIPDWLAALLVGQGRFDEAREVYAKVDRNWKDQHALHRQALKMRTALVHACAGEMDRAASFIAEVIEDPGASTANLILAFDFFRLYGDSARYRKCYFMLLTRYAVKEKKGSTMDRFFITTTPQLLSQTPMEIIDMFGEEFSDLGRFQLSRLRRNQSDLEGIKASREVARKLSLVYGERGFPCTQTFWNFATALADAELGNTKSANKLYAKGVTMLRENSKLILADDSFGFASTWLMTHVYRQEVENVLGLPVLPLGDFPVGDHVSD